MSDLLQPATTVRLLRDDDSRERGSNMIFVGTVPPFVHIYFALTRLNRGGMREVYTRNQREWTDKKKEKQSQKKEKWAWRTKMVA